MGDASGGSGRGQTGPAVLVTDARWRKALAAARALGRRGVRVLTTDATRLVAAAASRYVARHVVLPAPARDPDGFLAGVAAVARAEGGLVVFPMEDPTVALLARTRDRLPGVVVPLPPRAAVEAALDKAAVAARAAALGIPAPRTVAPAPGADVAAAAAPLAFPVVVKPRTAWGSQGVTYVERPADLPAAWARVAARFPAPLVQERVPPGGEAYGVSCLLNAAGALRAAFVHRRLREYPLTGGPSTARVGVTRPDLTAQSVRLLRDLGWTGFAMVEWKTDPRDGVARVLEVNPRFVGSLELALRSGVDFPWLLYRLAVDGDCPESPPGRTGVVCRWLVPGDLLHFLANPARLRLEPSFFRFRGPEVCYDDWAADDRRASLAQLGVTALQALRPSLWRYARSRSTPLPP